MEPRKILVKKTVKKAKIVMGTVQRMIKWKKRL